MKAEVAFWWCCAIGGVVFPAVILLAQACVPNTLLATGKIGPFESATVSVGGYFAPTTTTIQAADASIAVSGQFSAPHGQSLRLEERVKSGLQLCTHGQSHVCAPVAGEWPRALQPTGAKVPLLSFLAGDSLRRSASFWLACGLLATFFAGIMAIGATAPTSDETKEAESSA